MALRPGSRLLMSSHFMPLPRSSMIRASSSGDHLDCFLAGDSAVWAGCRRFAGTETGGGAGGMVAGVGSGMAGGRGGP